MDWPDDDRIAWPDNDYVAVILQRYLADGRGARGRVGRAAAELLDARDHGAVGALRRRPDSRRAAGPMA